MAATPSGIEVLVRYVDGFPLPSQGFLPENFRKILSLPVRAGDVILSTYPKCGTTWTQYIVWGLLNDGRPPPSGNRLMFKDFPFLELTGPKPFLDLPDPRLAKLHLPYEMVPKCTGCKLIHVLRNPFDASVSMWHHLLQIDAAIMGIEVPYDAFFETFLQGTCMFGDYFKHEESWFAHRNDPDVLYLTFESMKRDPGATVRRVADFLGMALDGRLMEDVLRHTSFSYVKDNCSFRVGKDHEVLARLGPKYAEMATDEEALKDDSIFRTVDFFRKGKVGSSRDEMTDDQWRRLEQAIQEKVADSELRKLMLDTGK